MKTLIVLIENYAVGGANKYSEDLINSIEESFDHIELWGNPEAISSINHERIPKKVQFKPLGIFNISEIIKNKSRWLRILLRFLLLPFALLFNLYSLVSLCFNLNRIQPKRVLVCNGGYPASLYLVFSLFFIKNKFKPTMTIVSTPAKKNVFFLNFLWSLIDRSVQAKANSIIVNSQAIKDQLIAQHHFNQNNIFIVRNGVADTAELPRLGNDTLSIGFVSRLENAKGVQELLLAYNKIQKSHPKIKLIIAGDGSLNQEVISFAKENPSVTFLGHYSGNISKLLATIDIFILPSYQEGLPYSIIEACMASCSIIATNVGGIPEIIKHNHSGILIPARDCNALYDAIEELLSNPTKRILLAKNARSVFLENFTLDKMKEAAKFLS